MRGDGEPIRFWSGSDYAWRIPFQDKNRSVSPTERASVAHHARWAAKRGINMVRFHGHLPPKRQRNGPPVPQDGINDLDLHGAWEMVAAFKKEGIYSTISPYWGSHTDNEENWDLGFEGGSLTGLVFFYEPVQEMDKRWLRRLYTGLMRKFNAEMNRYLRDELGCRQLINAGNWKTVDSQLTSVTGEIRTDYNRGIYTVNAPRWQAAAGFLAEQPAITLNDLTIRCRNRYGAIVVVPLDDLPLAESVAWSCLTEGACHHDRHSADLLEELEGLEWLTFSWVKDTRPPSVAGPSRS